MKIKIWRCKYGFHLWTEWDTERIDKQYSARGHKFSVSELWAKRSCVRCSKRQEVYLRK